jgi:hypothetical protein
MNSPLLTSIGITNVRGAMGGQIFETRNGKLTSRPRKKMKLSQSVKARWTRLMYVAIESLWNHLTPAEKQKWLQNVKVPKLSGRDLFGRVNWHQVADFDEWHPTRDHLNPWAPVKARLDGNQPLPADVLALLGGAIVNQGGSLTVTARLTRQATASAATLPLAVAAAYAAINATPWTPWVTALQAMHTIRWVNIGVFLVDVFQGYALADLAIPDYCQPRDVHAEELFTGPSSGLYQGGVAAYACEVPALAGVNSGPSLAPNLTLAGGPGAITDKGAWAPLAPAAVPTQFSGYEAAGTTIAWHGRG